LWDESVASWSKAPTASRPTILWCAKPEHETQPVINANSPEELAAQIKASRYMT
jgi:hypothetical protein